MKLFNRIRGAAPAGILLLGLAAFSAGQAQAATITFGGSGTLTGTATTLTGDFTTTELPVCSGSGCSVTFSYNITGGSLTGGTFFVGNPSDPIMELTLGNTVGAIGSFTAVASTILGGSYPGTPTPTISSGALLTLGAALFGTPPALGSGFTISGAEFEANVTAVPLPAAAWLFGSALGLVGIMGGARRRAQRVQSTV